MDTPAAAPSAPTDAFLGPSAYAYRDTSDRYMKADARPEVFVNVFPDPAVMAARRSDTHTGTEPPLSVPLDGTALAVQSEFTDRQPDSIEAQMKYVADNLLPKDYFQAALEHNRMGQGYVSTYHVDKPFQGIQLLREEIRVPASSDVGTMLFGVPFVGPYNNVASYFPNVDQISDPRYTEPISFASTEARLPIAQPTPGEPPVAGAPGVSVAMRKVGA